MKRVVLFLVLVLLLCTDCPAAQSRQAALSETSPAKQLVLKAQTAPYAKSLQLLDEALVLAPSSAEIYTARAMSHESAEQFDKAIADCDKSIALDPEAWETYLIKGRCLQSAGEYNKALNAVADAEKHNNNERSYDRYQIPLIRGTCYYHLKRFDEASKQLRHALHMDDGVKCADAYYYLALCQIARGAKRGAVENLSTAIDTKPKPEYFKTRAKLYSELGDRKLAEQDLRKASSYKMQR
jgi:tetratricopeptide (TPR) repeat protein